MINITSNQSYENSSVNILCNGNRTCSQMTITSDSASININCYGDTTCSSTDISVFNSLTANIDCFGYRACFRLNVDIHEANSSSLKCELDPSLAPVHYDSWSLSDACYIDIYVYEGNIFSLDAIEQDAAVLNVYAYNTSQVIINGKGDFSLESLDLFAYTVKYMEINLASSSKILDKDLYDTGSGISRANLDSGSMGYARLYLPMNTTFN